MDNPLGLGLYIFLLLPGFIWVQVYEYHLLREKKEQFVKTLEIVLWSAFIWALAYAMPSGWFGGALRDQVVGTVKNSFNAGIILPSREWDLDVLINFFFVVYLQTFIAANAWGFMRKWRRVDGAIKYFTGRDWYSSVAFRFFNENVNKGVIVKVQGVRYMGILYGAPDTAEDKYIILTKVSVLPDVGSEKSKVESIPLVRHVLIKFDDIAEIQSLDESVLTVERKSSTLRNKVSRIWNWIKSKASSVWPRKLQREQEEENNGRKSQAR
jgi:hypothetical protein